MRVGVEVEDADGQYSDLRCDSIVRTRRAVAKVDKNIVGFISVS